MILPVYIYGQPVLRKEAEDITPDYPNLKELIENMFETMDRADGCGLAAPQIGLPIRVVVIDLDIMSDDYPEYKGYRKAFINPHIIETNDETDTMDEGTAGRFLVTAEVRVAEHRHHRLVSEEPHRVVRELHDIHERFGIGVAVHERIGQEERSLARAQDMHCTEVLVFLADADDFLRKFNRLAVLGVAARNERVGIARLDHH